MASKGILTLPPGVSRNSREGIELRRQAATKRSNRNSIRTPNERYEGMNRTENKLINQQARDDMYLGDVAKNQLDDIKKNLSTQVRWNQLPQMAERVSYEGLPSAPVRGDFNDWRQQQIDTAEEDFNRRYQDQFSTENQEFETSMRERGIPIGSDLYNNLKDAQARRQNDAMLANLRAAQESAGSNASQFFSVGTQARANALGERLGQYQTDTQYRNDRIADYMMRRNQPLADYMALQGAQSGMGQQAYMNQQQNYSQGLAAAAAMNQINAQNAGAMARLQYQAQNEPTYGMSYQQILDAQNASAQRFADQNKPKTPSYWGQLGGGLGGGLLGGLVGGIIQNG